MSRFEYQAHIPVTDAKASAIAKIRIDIAAPLTRGNVRKMPEWLGPSGPPEISTMICPHVKLVD